MEEQKPIGFQIGELSRLFRCSIKNSIGQEVIGSTSFYVLSYLARHKNEKITLSSICAYSKLSKPTISLAIQSLEHDGYVAKEKDKTDSRKSFICLTDKGVEMNQQLHRVFVAHDHLLENSVSQEELEVFYRCLAKMKLSLKERMNHA